MCILIVGGICKLIFTVAFLKFSKLAVESVAVATIATDMLTCTLSLTTLLKNKDALNISFKNIVFDIKELKQILFNGIPSGVQSLLYAFANVIIATTVNSFGPDATTGIAIANLYDGIIYQVAYAPSLAVIPFVSQNMGAGNLKRIRKTIISGIFITIIFCGSLGFLSAFFSRELSYLMTSSEAVVEYSRQKMILVSGTYFICGINEVLGGTLKGMGKPIPPAVTSLVFLCLLRFIWVYFIFPVIPNMTFLYTVWPVGWGLSIITLMAVYFIDINKLQKKTSVFSPKVK